MCSLNSDANIEANLICTLKVDGFLSIFNRIQIRKQ
jgi:hypothetical protein